MTEDEIRQIVREELTRLQEDVVYDYVVWDLTEAMSSSVSKKAVLGQMLKQAGWSGFRVAGIFPDFIGIPIVLLERRRPKGDKPQ